jgi:hypothetical protein
MAKTSFTSVGSEADSPEPFLRPSPATGHDAEMLEVSDPDLGYDAGKFPYQPPQRGMRRTCRTGLWEGYVENISGAALGRIAKRTKFVIAGRAAMS